MRSPGSLLPSIICSLSLFGCHEAKRIEGPLPPPPAPPVALPAPAHATPSPVDPAVCPSAVAGAATRVKDISDGVELTIIAQSPAAVRQVRDRAMKLIYMQSLAHREDGLATCAIHYIPSAETTIEDVKNGVRVTISTQKPELVSDLRKSMRARVGVPASKSRQSRHGHS